MILCWYLRLEWFAVLCDLVNKMSAPMEEECQKNETLANVSNGREETKFFTSSNKRNGICTSYRNLIICYDFIAVILAAYPKTPYANS